MDRREFLALSAAAGAAANARPDLQVAAPAPPWYATIRRVAALRSGRVLPFEQDGAAVRFEVPAVVDYEVVALT